MPSFDVVSEVDMQEVRNAVDQASRELGTRFDFKGLTPVSSSATPAFAWRRRKSFSLDRCLTSFVTNSSAAGLTCAPSIPEIWKRQVSRSASVGLKQGIDRDTAKKIVKMIKDQQDQGAGAGAG